MCNLPQDTGLYWAKRDYSKNYTYIINVKGKTPFLSYTSWNLKYPDRNEDSGLAGTTLAVSDEINITTNNKNITEVLNNGLYLLSGKNPTLVFITGVAPYMSCYLWNILNDVKKKHRSPWLLPLVKYIETPEVPKISV